MSGIMALRSAGGSGTGLEELQWNYWFTGDQADLEQVLLVQQRNGVDCINKW